uniref:DNA-binding transcriptional dual regulator n=1 Tax=Magnetococcus massalia (strain MO-1) TaxID=451514 RepID=A0A1S7LFS9_MAGMO|nr:DNA-binding transcriptional dual regulator [Candidatus Magnetococcus massalia]
MNLNQMRFIDAVARLRHFGRAAKACHVSQPTLSIGIRKLEDELGVILFERSKTDVRLTDAGQEVITLARQIVDASSRIKELGKSRRDPLLGPLRLGVINTIGPYLLPKLIPAMREKTPQMPLRIEEDYTDVLIEHLKQGSLDLLIIARECSEPGLAVLPLYEEPFLITVPEDHHWADRDQINGTELSEESLLLLRRGHCLRDQVLALCPECLQTHSDPTHLTSVLESSSLETIRHMVMAGSGITVLPSTVTEQQSPAQGSLKYIPFAPPAPHRTVSLVWRHSFYRMPAIESLASVIRSIELPSVRLLQEEATIGSSRR